ncbi:uncharacterized protein PHALS_02857 [Plasmopara halstedii]|uniref:Uncharacterized protein n=1 Tax=Plasmopara halstedii TaxID=4781 RepID=A0A0P1AZT5_PLAHL|nr:uncharacterized protein PHALS_02857 [Plasmopara halstedii]CEG46456.1 hypothetical protein PHALS_02857 [Plasmopara halstedii]|eukprot:XP_024582825.1 hypothetical protein PHALS_02857 [Plasmopara halstedii]
MGQNTSAQTRHKLGNQDTFVIPMGYDAGQSIIALLVARCTQMPLFQCRISEVGCVGLCMSSPELRLQLP